MYPEEGTVSTPNCPLAAWRQAGYYLLVPLKNEWYPGIRCSFTPLCNPGCLLPQDKKLLLGAI